MAIKKRTDIGTSTYQDIFDTAEALDTGILNQVQTGSTRNKGKVSGFLGLSSSEWDYTTPTIQTKENFGEGIKGVEGESILSAVQANRKRRLEQQGAKGTGSSILGGGAF